MGGTYGPCAHMAHVQVLNAHWIKERIFLTFWLIFRVGKHFSIIACLIMIQRAEQYSKIQERTLQM